MWAQTMCVCMFVFVSDRHHGSPASSPVVTNRVRIMHVRMFSVCLLIRAPMNGNHGQFVPHSVYLHNAKHIKP